MPHTTLTTVEPPYAMRAGDIIRYDDERRVLVAVNGKTSVLTARRLYWYERALWAIRDAAGVVVGSLLAIGVVLAWSFVMFLLWVECTASPDDVGAWDEIVHGHLLDDA